MRRTVKTRPTAGHDVRHIDVGRQRALGPEFARYDRPDRWEQVIVRHPRIAVGEVGTVAGHYVVIARVVAVVAMAVAADDCVPVSQGCA